MKTYLIRGVPMQMQQDGWWMDGAASRYQNRAQHRKEPPIPTRVLLLFVLIVLGDVLVWQIVPGVSLAVFGGVLLAAALCRLAKWRGQRHLFAVTAGGVLAFLPLVELVQPLSVVIAVAGLSVLLAVLADANIGQIARAALRLWPLGIFQGLVEVRQIRRGGGPVAMSALLRHLVMRWLVPVAFGLVFVLLLIAANPVADRWITQLAQVEIGLPGWPRSLFWLALVPVAWTVVSLDKLSERLRAEPRSGKFGPRPQGIVNPASTTRALFLFNGVFALQTLMDLVYLYAGVGLPDGITYAEYAHRGAYPLLATALLAGGFALFTQHWMRTNRMLRILMLVWISQNVALVTSSLVRLDLYVDVFGLTHLRIAAGIWMVLVACGLVLILWQVWRGRSNQWLLLRIGAMGAGVLYLSAFVSFDAMIARHNLQRAEGWDQAYVCQLGDAAQPVIVAQEVALSRPLCRRRHQITAPRDWREWGFRNWRARNSLSALQAEGTL